MKRPLLGPIPSKGDLMKPRITIPLLFVAGLAAVAVALASGATGNDQKPGTSGSAGASIGIRGTALGKILVDADGRTLYLFEADQPDKSNCSGACLSLWPAFTSASLPKATAGAMAGKIGTIPASDGSMQVTYAGHPLYYYAADQNPGDTTGQGVDQFGAEWYVLAPTGDKVDNG